MWVDIFSGVLKTSLLHLNMFQFIKISSLERNGKRGGKIMRQSKNENNLKAMKCALIVIRLCVNTHVYTIWWFVSNSAKHVRTAVDFRLCCFSISALPSFHKEALCICFPEGLLISTIQLLTCFCVSVRCMCTVSVLFLCISQIINAYTRVYICEKTCVVCVMYSEL